MRSLFKPTPLFSKGNLSLLLVTLLLLFVGIIAVYDASSVDAFATFGNKYHFALQQLKWAGLGLIGFTLAAFIPLPLIRRFSTPFFLLCLLLLVVVLIPGLGTKVAGARRWINLAGFNLQPSELAKLGLVLYLSTWLQTPRPLAKFLTIVGVVIGLTILQPDLGTAIIISASSFLLYYFSGTPLNKLFLLGGLVMGAGLLLILISPYRKARLTTFLDPTSDTLGSSYHINQVLIALGSGGATGVGIGRSRQKYQYLPESPTDSIFAIIAEETGFVGSLLIIALFCCLFYLCYQVAINAKDHFSQLLVGGITGWISSQFILNLAAMTALTPLTGIPLPLISYGGSALITTLTSIGLIINVNRNIHKSHV